MTLLFLLACGDPSATIPTAEVASGTFEVVLAASGTLEAVKETEIRAPDLKGRPKIAWMAETGARVAEGDRIVEFDRVELEQKLQNALNELDLARTRILQNNAKLALTVQEAESGITKAELDLRLARMRRTDSDTVPLVDREEARVSEKKSEMAIDAARSNLQSVHLESRAETQLLQLEVEQKEREVETLREQLENTVITAPSDGLVIIEERWDGTPWRVGQTPWDGAFLAALPDFNAMKVAAEVHEVDSPRVAVDQRATVRIESLPDLTLSGTVSKVADLAVDDDDDGVKVLDIEVTLDTTLPEMKPGLSTRVELVVEEVEDALWIPIEAVWREDDAEPTVWVAGLTGWSQVNVALGTESDTHVVVTSGLSAGDEVALVDPNATEARTAADP